MTLRHVFPRQQPIPLIQHGGHQPYATAGGQAPGQALAAMLAGRTLYGQNPMDAKRQSQLTARTGQRTLLDTLLG